MDPLYLAGCAWHMVVSDLSHFSVHFNHDMHVFSLALNASVRILYVWFISLDFSHEARLNLKKMTSQTCVSCRQEHKNTVSLCTRIDLTVI